MKDLKFRVFKKDDIKAVIELINKAYRENNPNSWTSEAHLLSGIRVNEDMLNEILENKNIVTYIALLDEKIAATIQTKLEDEDIHVGPSDYVPWQKDNKVAFIRIEGKLFGDVPMNLEMRLSVEDSPNSAGVVIDAIRCCKLGLDRGIGGVLTAPSAYFMKHPPEQFTDDEAYQMTEAFINEQ